MYVCVCNAVTERTLLELVDEGCTTIAELQSRIGVADCCGTCHDHAAELLDQALKDAHGGLLPPSRILPRLPVMA
ncbi:(2Fe-2S)-binding protein [Wenzhouxiangella sp. AB-CW3]|nr:(2Fe-2S)-binding protein [Wenzhouxiangella sp. AB-CW3]